MGSSSPWTRSIGVVHGLGVSEMYQPDSRTLKKVIQKYNLVALHNNLSQLNTTVEHHDCCDFDYCKFFIFD